MKNNHSSFTLMGEVVNANANDLTFSTQLLSKETVSIKTTKTTYYQVLPNIGDASRDRVTEPDASAVEQQLGKRENASDKDVWDAQQKVIKYLKEGEMICVIGVRSTTGQDVPQLSARRVVLMHSEPKNYGWEETHWWIQQINTLFEQWLDVLFDSKRNFIESDFAKFYKTNLDLLGGNTTNNTQECATMSRFLYGLSSSYLLTGNQRALSAARACSRYLINAYTSPSHDGKHVIWKFGRVKEAKSTKEIFASLNPDDNGTFALYEQIYALSGLAQYYRATQDTWVLGYIIRTIATFQDYYLDIEKPGDPCFTGQGGYFSHIDPVTLRPDAPALDNTGNREKKNWNSIGDHIPAYLINLIVSIDPLPKSDSNEEEENFSNLKTTCIDILEKCVNNILNHFGPTDGSKFVYERFDKNWNPDLTWGWQQDRGIVGHNLKISWNLTRCGHYFKTLAEQHPGEIEEAKYEALANKCYDFSIMMGNNMKEAGVDQIRGGIFDALERHPKNGSPTEFAWSSTKDFWQQEQAILAYYIMQGIGDIPEKEDFLKMARFCSAFWNLFFVDQDNRKIFFRTTESGEPVIEGQYGIQGGHAIAGYHAFELNYLAYIYINTYVDRGAKHNRNFVLYYKPVKNTLKTLNLLPEFFSPDQIEIASIKINGMTLKSIDEIIIPNRPYQMNIEDLDENSVVMVEYHPLGFKESEPKKDKEHTALSTIEFTAV